MASKVARGLVAVIALAALCTACGERERHEQREEKKMAAPASGCCQKADNTCAGPVTEEECGQMNGTFTEGMSCQADGQCGMESPQAPDSPQP